MLLKVTIRKSIATSNGGENAVHISDGDENTSYRSCFHFAGREQF
jgi:nucleoside-diphosphate kinase